MSVFRIDKRAVLDRLPGWLTPSSPRPGRGGSPRIAILGHCQGAAIATAMRLLLPEAEISFISTHTVLRRFAGQKDLVSALSDRDVVFGTPFPHGFRAGGDYAGLREETGLIPYPAIVFSAFHPDAIYVGDVWNPATFVRTPLGDYNSALGLFGFLKGLSVEETLRLFDEAVYRQLGYLEAWDGAAASLLQIGRDAGYDLAADLVRWSRRGAFMHVINHPRMFVTNDLARGLLRRAGIPFEDCDLDSFAADEIARRGAWPVYPPVAARLGIEGGGYAFLKPAEGRRPPATTGLRAFIAESFRTYRAHDRARLRSERVEAWLANSALADDLARRARSSA